MMVKPVVEGSDEEGNANLTSSDDSSNGAQSVAENGAPGANRLQTKNPSFMTNNNKMPEMLDGFSLGRGLYTNTAAGINKDECGDGDLSDAGVESIILSSDDDKNNSLIKKQIIEKVASA